MNEYLIIEYQNEYLFQNNILKNFNFLVLFF